MNLWNLHQTADTPNCTVMVSTTDGQSFRHFTINLQYVCVRRADPFKSPFGSLTAQIINCFCFFLYLLLGFISILDFHKKIEKTFVAFGTTFLLPFHVSISKRHFGS